MNLSMFEEVWYTGERELPVICRVAEQKLAFEVTTLKLQLDYGARMSEAILESSTCVGPKIPHSHKPAQCGHLLPQAVYLQKLCGGHLPPMDGLTRSVTVMAFQQRHSHTDKA